MIDAFVPRNLPFEEVVVLSLLIGASAAIGILAAPRVVRWCRRWIAERTGLGIGEDRTVRLGTVIVQRVVQIGMAGAGSVALLALWGYRSILEDGYAILATTFPTISRVLLTSLLLLGAYLAINSTQVWVERTTGRARRFNEHDQEIVKRIVQLLILFTSALLVLLIWQIDVSGLLVGAGVLGIIIGYAARDTLSSIIAGLVLMFSRPFEIGDWVVIGEEQGIVTDITIVNTRVRSPDGDHVILPNTEIHHRTVRNLSHEPRLRFSVDVGIDFSSNVEHAQTVAIEAIEDLEIVAETPFPSALVDRVEDSSIVLRIRFWVNRPNAEKKWQAEHQVLEAITEAFDREGVHIPYPHQRFVTGEKNQRPDVRE